MPDLKQGYSTRLGSGPHFQNEHQEGAACTPAQRACPIFAQKKSGFFVFCFRVSTVFNLIISWAQAF